MPVPIIADYREQREAFAALLEPACTSRILFFSGASGSGKTTLMQVCLDELGENLAAIRIEMRGNATPIPEIFSRVGERRGWDSMPNFIETLRAIPKVVMDGNRLVGINHQINIALNVPREDRYQRTTDLTNAWFTDLRSEKSLHLIAIDTYERALPEVQEWLAGPFLARAMTTPTLRVVIAGQSVPDPRNIEWGACCTHYPLHGVPEAIHWLPVVDHLHRYIDAPDPLSWLAGVCHAYNGDPLQIMQIIEGLPREGMAG